MVPPPLRGVTEVAQRATVAAYAIVGVVPAYPITQLPVLALHRFVAMPFAPLPDFHEGGAELLALGFALHGVASVPRLRPVVGEAEEVEGLRFAFTAPRGAEVHDPGFLRVER